MNELTRELPQSRRPRRLDEHVRAELRPSCEDLLACQARGRAAPGDGARFYLVGIHCPGC